MIFVISCLGFSKRVLIYIIYDIIDKTTEHVRSFCHALRYFCPTRGNIMCENFVMVLQHKSLGILPRSTTASSCCCHDDRRPSEAELPTSFGWFIYTTRLAVPIIVLCASSVTGTFPFDAQYIGRRARASYIYIASSSKRILKI